MGRKKIPAVPAAMPNTAQTLTDLMSQQVEQAKARAAAGQRLANHESRALRDAWLLDQAKHIWPSMEAAAADLGVSLTTVRGYAEEGCPNLIPHSPIPKAGVLTWLLQRAHTRGGQPHANKDSIEAAELRIKVAKAEQLERRLVAEAEDRASQAVLDTLVELRERLLRELPGQLAAEARNAADLAAAEELLIAHLTDALRDRPLSIPTNMES
jgi:hypothetical protein